MHCFHRGSYGCQQSLGCVELPRSSAQSTYDLLTYGSLVTVTGDQGGRRSGPGSSGSAGAPGWRPARPRSGCPGRPGQPGPPSAGVHVDQFGDHGDPQAGLDQPDQLRPPGDHGGHRHPRLSSGSGWRRPRSQNPPSSAGPEHGVGLAAGQRLRRRLQRARGDLRGIHADQHDRQRRPRVGVRASRRRSARPARCPAARSPRTPGGSQARAARQASSARRTGRVAVDRLERVGQRGLGQGRRLMRVNGGVSLVLTRPGTGSFASTMIWAAGSLIEASTLRMSRTVRIVPPTVPVTFDFRFAGSTGRRLADPPAGRGGRDHSLQRVAEPAVVRSRASRSSRRAARIGPMSCSRTPGRRRSRRRARRCRAGRARARRRALRPAAAQDQVGLAAPDRPATAARSGGSRDPSASMKQTRSSGGGQQAGVAGGAVAALRHVHDGGASVAATIGRTVGRSRCRPRSAGTGGHPGQQPGQGACFVQARQTRHPSYRERVAARHGAETRGGGGPVWAADLTDW